MNTTTKLVATALVSVFAGAALVVAGPLDPPAGPIVPTYKTLTEVEPRIIINSTNTPGDADSIFKITAAGSYYLTANVTPGAGRSGIEIGASNVTIDLMGFSIIGAAGSLDGISNSAATVNDVRITNGTIESCGGDGIQLNSGTNHQIDHVKCHANGNTGITVDDNAIVESCSAWANTFEGLSVTGHNAAVRGCVVYGNGGDGIRIFNSGVIEGCTAYSNASGIRTGIGSTVSSCSARDNTGDGITVSSACTAANCSAYSNGDDGIVSTSTSTIISGCTASFNTGDGIEVPGNCTLVGNICDANGQGAGIGAGVKVTGTDCRVDGNTLMRNDLGMDVQLSGSFIIRNAAAGNTTNYQIIANNKVGFIVSAPNSIAIAGSVGGAGVGSTDPWANFSY